MLAKCVLGIGQYTIEHAHGEDNRSVAAAISMILKGGNICMSIYLHDGQGPSSAANIAILQATAAFLATAGGPWVVCADFNCTPNELSNIGWTDMVGGVIKATEGPTCGAHRYDFFVVETSLAPAVAGVQRITDAGLNPHIPARHILKASECRRLVRRLVKPPLVPGLLPHGPASEQDTARANAPATKTKGYTVDDQADSWITEARTDFSARCGEHVNQHQKPYFRWEPAVKRKALDGGSITHAAATWRAAGNRVAELASLARQRGTRHRDTPQDAQKRMLETLKYLQQTRTQSSTQPDADALAAWIDGATAIIPKLDATQLARHSAAALKHARRTDQAAAREATKEFNAWLSIGSVPSRGSCRRLPGRNAYRYVRGPLSFTRPARGDAGYNTSSPEDADDHDDEQEEEADTYCRAGTTAEDNEVLLTDQWAVEKEADMYGKLWCEGKQRANIPTGPMDVDSPFTVTSLSLAAGSLPVGTGLGADDMSPGAFDELSDDRLQQLADLLNECESLGT